MGWRYCVECLVLKSKCDSSFPYSSLSTLHSINLLTFLLSSGFAWGQAKSKLGGVDTSSLNHYFTSVFTLIHRYISFYDASLMLFCPLLQTLQSIREEPLESGNSWKNHHQLDISP